ncbi:unnamed protein product [Ectocarpus sp. 8 AP-2014]
MDHRVLGALVHLRIVEVPRARVETATSSPATARRVVEAAAVS